LVPKKKRLENQSFWLNSFDYLLKIVLLKKYNFKEYKVAIVSNEGPGVKRAVILLVL